MAFCIKKILFLAFQKKRLCIYTQKQKPELSKKGIFSLTAIKESIFRCLPTDKTCKEIGEALGLKSRTVDWHVDNIFGKLGVSTRACANDIGSFKSDNVY